MAITLLVSVPLLDRLSYNDAADVLRGVYSNTTQLNWPSWTAYSQVSRVFVFDVTTYKLSQLLFTLSSWVELSCVAINGPLLAAATRGIILQLIRIHYEIAVTWQANSVNVYMAFVVHTHRMIVGKQQD